MLDIKIYGTSTPSYQLAKVKLIDALEGADIRYHLEEVTSVTDIMRDQVESVPAVRVNDRYLFQMRPNGHYNQSLREAIQKVLRLDNYGSMSKIIVPTDFSEASFGAYNFANLLAKQIHGVLWLTHVYHPVSTDINQLVTVSVEAENAHQHRLQSFVDSLNQDWIGNFITEPIVEGVFKVGFPRVELEEMSKTQNTVMVMGTTGAGDAFKKIFGSLSLDMAGSVSCPLFLIPPGASFSSMKRIMYLSEDLNFDSTHLLYVAGIASNLGIPLSLVHFRSDRKDDYNVQDAIDLFETFYPELEFTIDITDTNDLFASIHDLVGDRNDCLVALSTRHRNVFEQIFHRSVTDFAAVHTHCPLLILSDKVKERIYSGRKVYS
jgi:nucleotide-binding universal stress UspA family protein